MKPKFLPKQWVVFEQGDTSYLGKIVGARYFKSHNGSGLEWRYTVEYGQNSPMDVEESAITHYVRDDEYVAT
jgi:hypothetical protein